MTSPAALRYFHRTGLWLAVAFALGLLAILVRSSLADGVPREILIGLPGLLWLTAPILAAAALVGASSTRAGAMAFLMLELALILSATAELAWGGPLGLVMLPVLHAVAILLAFVPALALGWRMRPDFLRD